MPQRRGKRGDRAGAAFDAAPAELRARPQWVLWTYRVRGEGKPTKLPIRAESTGMASSTDPETWTTFEKAVAAWAAGKGDGIGFVFTENDPYCGLDLDHCRKDGTLAPWAAELIDRFDSYAEVSPSGEGVKIWIRAEKRAKQSRADYPADQHESHIEIYDRGRYFTLTGECIRPHSGIADAQDQLDALSAELFSAEPRREKDAADIMLESARLGLQDYELRTDPAGGYSANKDLSGSGEPVPVIERARRWMEKRDPAIEGQAGDTWTFKTACALVRGFELPHDQAMELLREWNRTCTPPWTAADLEAKIASARRNGKEPFGYLLAGREGQERKRDGGQDGTGASSPRAAGRGDHGQPAPTGRDDEGGDGHATAETPGGAPAELTNVRTEWEEDGDGNRTPKHLARHIRDIVDSTLEDLGDSFGRLGGMLFYAREDGRNRLGEAVAWMDGAVSLFGFLQDRYDCIRWREKVDKRGVNFVSRGEFHDQVTKRAPAYLAITGYPFAPQDPRVFCQWTEPKDYPADGSALAGFLDFFNPATDRDADLLAAMVLTLFWGDHPGGRPLFVITGNEEGVQQGIGKSACARYCAKLVGDAIELEMPKRGSFADGLKKQALEEVNLHKRVGLLDNHTGTLRDDTLTDLVTAQMISGRASYAKQAERLNLITWIVTTNEPNLSDDISSRTVLLRLAPADRQKHPHWEREVGDYVREHGDRIAADCIAILSDGPAHGITASHTRFSSWDCAVLSRLETVNECLEHIHAMARENNSDTDEILEFLEVLHARDPGPNPVLNRERMKDAEWLRSQATNYKAKSLVAIWEEALGKEFNVSALGRILKNARARGQLHGLDKHSKRNGAPWSWRPWEYREATGAEWAEARTHEEM